nr:sigma-70 family RNA polymerase sigma factor [Evansella caseinilytica]
MKGREEGKEINDQALIQQVLRGNDHAFRILIETYRGLIYKAVYGVLRNEKDAEDAVQEVFLKIYSSLPKYHGKGLKSWMIRIAVNHAIDMKRKRDRRREEIIDDVEIRSLPSTMESVEGEIIHREMRQYIHGRIHELPENYRNVVFGYYIKEKSLQQLAAEERINEKSVRVKLHRARKWMKKRWKEDDFS